MSASLDSARFWCNEKQPEFQANAAIKAFISEVSKGCTDHIFQNPLLCLSPEYHHFNYRNIMYDDPIILSEPIQPTSFEQYAFISVYFNKEDGSEWLNGVFGMLTQVYSVSSMFFYEIIANKKEIRFQFCVPKVNLALFSDALKSRFPHCEFEASNQNDFLKTNIDALKDKKRFELEAYYPFPPYHRNLFVTVNKSVSIIVPLLYSISSLEGNELFYYRVAIEPAIENWDRNILNVHTYEHHVKDFYPDLNVGVSWFIPPSAESKKAIQMKLDPERTPFFFVSPMMVFFGGTAKFKTIKSFMNTYRFGDQAYQTIPKFRFISKIGEEKTISFIENRRTHIHGHPLNRFESALFIPFPCENAIENNSFHLSTIHGKCVPALLQDNGIFISENMSSGQKVKLHLPFDILQHSIAVVGSQGFGKTNEILNIITQIASNKKRKYSIVIFYFHDFSFVTKFISGLPDDRLSDVILAMPKLEGKILARNIVDGTGIEDTAKKAAIIQYAIDNYFSSIGVDVRFITKNALHSLILSEHSAFDNIINILNKDDIIGKIKRQEVRRKTSNRLLLEFLDIIENKGEDTKKIINKIQELFDDSSVASMCSYTGQDKFSLKEVIKEGKILIYYLGGIGPAGNAIASMEASLLHQHFLDYSSMYSEPYFPTIAVIDEAQRVKAKGISDSIREDRKYGLSYLISTQSLNGIDPSLKEGIDLIPTLCFFQCTEDDAKYFWTKTSGQISSKDIMSLKKYEMYARILSSEDVYLGKTIRYEPGDLKKLDYVKKNCLEKYYISPEEIVDLRKEHEKSLILGGRPKSNISKFMNIPASIADKIKSNKSKGGLV